MAITPAACQNALGTNAQNAQIVCARQVIVQRMGANDAR